MGYCISIPSCSNFNMSTWIGLIQSKEITPQIEEVTLFFASENQAIEIERGEKSNFKIKTFSSGIESQTLIFIETVLRNTNLPSSVSLIDLNFELLSLANIQESQSFYNVGKVSTLSCNLFSIIKSDWIEAYDGAILFSENLSGYCQGTIISHATSFGALKNSCLGALSRSSFRFLQVNYTEREECSEKINHFFIHIEKGFDGRSDRYTILASTLPETELIDFKNKAATQGVVFE